MLDARPGHLIPREAPLPWERDIYGMKVNLLKDSTPAKPFPGHGNRRDLNQDFDGENEKTNNGRERNLTT